MNTRWNAMAIGMAGTLMAAGCADSSGTGGVVMSHGQLAAELATAPLRLEVTFNQDGTVREVEVEDDVGHGTEFEGKVSAFDATTGRLTLEVLGDVDVTAVSGFRGEDRADLDAATWYAALQEKLAAAEPAWVDARGDFAGELFAATELRFEDDEETKIEADVTAENFDPATGILKIGALEVDLTDALIQTGDDSDEPSDREDGDEHHGDDDGDHRDGDDDGDHRDGDDDGDHRDGDDDGDHHDGDDDGDHRDGDDDGDHHDGDHDGDEADDASEDAGSSDDADGAEDAGPSDDAGTDSGAE